LKTIKHIVSRYSDFLWHLLAPLGSWGVFAIAAIDSSFIGLPLDPMFVGYVYSHPHKMLLYVLMASGGSAVGSLVIYAIGYSGGEALLRKRSPQRFAKIHAGFEEHPFWTLMAPAMLPPPTPFKLFLLGAGVSEMNLLHFLLAIFAGRCVRFLVEGVLTVTFGPAFVQMAGTVFREHFSVVIGVVIGAAAAWLILRQRRRRRLTAESAKEA
jgi:membrane protein YqaA with SNARE-associated domain